MEKAVKKVDFIHCRIEPEIKRRLREKARDEGLDLTEFIEKIAKQQVVFLDDNVRRLLDALKFVPKVC
jgi:hypothetical protein